MAENTPGRVSVIIPARNEEEHIERCLSSVADQRGVREIIVVDDQSTDRTPAILERLKEEIPALRVLRVELLPEGWLGKCWALATGARAASGDWLLFTDADTEHAAGSLAESLERSQNHQVDLFSLSPGQLTPTWWEKAVIPLVYAWLSKTYAFEEINDPASPTAAANGQYLLVRRAVYEKVGGHATVKGEILEDVALAQKVKRAGGRLLFLPGARWVHTRMYRTFPEMWEGWTKNLHLLGGGRVSRVLRTVARFGLLGILPNTALVIILVLAASRRVHGTAPLLIALLALALVVGRLWSYWRSLRRLGFDGRLAACYFPGELIFSLLLLNSAYAHRCRSSVQWKGRAYSTKGAWRR